MDPQTKRIRIWIFIWNNEHKFTERVEERAVILPPEIEVKKDIYTSKELRTKLAENLLAQLYSEDYATPEHIDTLANSRIQDIGNDYYNQIIVSMWDILVVNTENHGVIFWDLKKIAKENEQLLHKDSQRLQEFTGEQEGYSVTYLINWAPGDACVIMSQH